MADDTSEPVQLGTNVQMEVVDDVATFTVNLAEDHGPSSTGKSRIVGSTHGGKKVAGDPNLRVAVNIYKVTK